MGFDDEEKVPKERVNLIAPPEWKNKSPPEYSPPSPSWQHEGGTSTSTSLNGLSSGLGCAIMSQQKLSVDHQTTGLSRTACSDENCTMTGPENLDDPNISSVLATKPNNEFTNIESLFSADLNTEYGVLILLEYLDRCSNEIKLLYSMFKKLSDIEKARAKEMLKYSENYLAMKDNYVHKTVGNTIIELFGTIRTVAEENLRHSEELGKSCERLLMLSKFARNKHRYNREMFKPEQKHMYNSVTQLSKAKSKYDSSISDLENASNKGKRIDNNHGVISANRSAVMSFLFKQSDSTSKLEEAKIKANNLFGLYREKLEYTTECSEAFFKIQIPGISRNLKKSADELGIGLSDAIREVVSKVVSRPQKEANRLSEGNNAFLRRLNDMDLNKDFEMFIRGDHSSVLPSQMQKSELFSHRTKTARGLPIPSQDSSPVTPKSPFGLSLDVLVVKENRDVPDLVSKCVQHIEENALDVTGIYRIPGSAKKISRLKLLAVLDVDNIFSDSDLEIHAVAGLLKTFFRELPAPLIPASVIENFNDTEVCVEGIKNALANVSRSNLRVFRFIVKHLKKVSEHSHLNQMTCSNLAMIWSQTLIGFHSEDEISQVVAVGKRCSFLKNVISNCDVVFDDDL